MPTRCSIASAAGSFARRSSNCRAKVARLSARTPSTSPDPRPPRPAAALVGGRVDIPAPPPAGGGRSRIAEQNTSFCARMCDCATTRSWYQLRLMRHRSLQPRPGLDEHADQVAARLRALADPVRLRLLALLARGDCPVGVLAAAVGVGQSLASFHLAALRDAGLITTERAGRFTYVRLQLPAVAGLFGEVTDLITLDQPHRPGHGGGPMGTVADPTAPRRRSARRSSMPRPLDPASPQAFARSLERLTGARITDFLPLFVDRFSRERLRALAQAQGTLAKEVPEVLFVCVHNAGRSQMAAALLDHHAQGRVHVRSAGSDPADRVNPAVVQALDELGIDMSREFPKPLTDEVVQAADAVVTMGCGDACPIYPGKRDLDWELDDPEGKPVEQVRAIRDDID